MTKCVLCAVDVSNADGNMKTLQVAGRLAALDDAQLDVIAVVPDYGLSQVGGFFSAEHHDEMVAHATEALNTIVTKALDAAQNDKVRHLVATGRAYEQILKTAERSGADLIVVGSHDPELSDYLLGPNSARVVRHARCSVYVVR